MLVNDLKQLINDFKEEEENAKAADNLGFLAGLQYARVFLETTLGKNGYNCPSTIEHVDEDQDILKSKKFSGLNLTLS